MTKFDELLRASRARDAEMEHFQRECWRYAAEVRAALHAHLGIPAEDRRAISCFTRPGESYPRGIGEAMVSQPDGCLAADLRLELRQTAHDSPRRFDLEPVVHIVMLLTATAAPAEPRVTLMGKSISPMLDRWALSLVEEAVDAALDRLTNGFERSLKGSAPA